MQISVLSSETEEASIGVPSLLVMDTRHNLSLKMTSAKGSSSSLPEAVAEEVVEILNFMLILSSLRCGSSSCHNIDSYSELWKGLVQLIEIQNS